MNSKALSWTDNWPHVAWPTIIHGLNWQAATTLEFWCDDPAIICLIFYRAGCLYRREALDTEQFLRLVKLLHHWADRGQWLHWMAEWMGSVNKHLDHLQVFAERFDAEPPDSTMEGSCLYFDSLRTARMFVVPSTLPGDRTEDCLSGPPRGGWGGPSWGVRVESIIDPIAEPEPFAREAFIVRAVAPLLMMPFGGLSWPILMDNAMCRVPAGILLAQAALRLWDEHAEYPAVLWDQLGEGMYDPRTIRSRRTEL